MVRDLCWPRLGLSLGSPGPSCGHRVVGSLRSLLGHAVSLWEHSLPVAHPAPGLLLQAAAEEVVEEGLPGGGRSVTEQPVEAVPAAGIMRAQRAPQSTAPLAEPCMKGRLEIRLVLLSDL